MANDTLCALIVALSMWLIPLAIILVIFILPLGNHGTIGQEALGALLKGNRVGAESSSNDGIEIAENPADLAASAGLDLDWTYAGARGISSEEGNSPNAHQVAVAWVFVNNARAMGATIFEWATDGSFGRQTGGVGSRPISTFDDPYDGHVTIMKAVLAGTLPDPTGGARYFVAPKAQNALHARDPDTYKPFSEVEASRIASGLKRVEVDGINPALLVFYA